MIENAKTTIRSTSPLPQGGQHEEVGQTVVVNDAAGALEQSSLPLVSKEQLAKSLTRLRQGCRRPAAGLYGPGSISWQVGRQSALFLAGGRAALLQLAHPAVAYGIEHHSRTRQSPLARFQRTFEHVFDMVFGDLDHAIRSAERVFAIHERIQGKLGNSAKSYAANDPKALFWVQATLIDSALLAYETFVSPLGGDEKNAYYLASRQFSALFGIPEQVMPPHHHAFRRYMATMIESVEVTEPARRMSDFILGSNTLRPAAVAQFMRQITSDLLPERLRGAYGLAGLQDGGRAARTKRLAKVRHVYQRLPAFMQEMPAYRDAKRRLRGQSGRDPGSLAFDRAMAFMLRGPGSGRAHRPRP